VTDHPTVVPARRPGAGRIVGFVVLLAAIAWGLGALAAWPWRASAPTGAIVRISVRHVSGFAGAVERRSPEELARLPAHTWIASRALEIADGASPLFEYQAGRGWLP